MDRSGRREQIIRAAREAFQSFGYKATTLDHIAKYANMGKGTFYLSFKTKEEVFTCIVDDELKQFARFAEESQHTYGTNVESLHHYICNVVNYQKQHPLFCKLKQEAEAFQTFEVKEGLIRIESTAFDQLQELIHNLMDNGSIEQCDVEFTAFLITELYTALLYKWGENHAPLSSEEILQIFKKFMQPGLCPETRKKDREISP
ncbi:transcriptional regulator, TetR family [Paenibacillus sp. 1_12]|uniref:TetR/AcrR family transcriptional regulator n=1 Tax=Paenibacillus sp. 1_12 TaxID=1566278 RepID=UPI0008DF739B|nr:TetR/AcrR family transcriptional regulator [Paenibacillus sp. 1_12]SFK74765.1 transcriptional regulator, TetR family [Paenibacillus sp. 1_12]